MRVLCLKDADGILRPLGFISPNNEAGKMRAQDFEKKFDEGDSIVECELTEV